MSYNNVVQLSGLAVALGGYMALVIWAYSDIWIRGRKTIYTNVIDTGIAAKIFSSNDFILLSEPLFLHHGSDPDGIGADGTDPFFPLSGQSPIQDNIPLVSETYSSRADGSIGNSSEYM